ncbi:ATP-binding domain-containing protein [Parabacteroides merdae]|uniref:ATP-binding domain-containing protein n=1 Tax=Parabacteroides merdae TaxID=46503 RepID=UPI0034A20DED
MFLRCKYNRLFLIPVTTAHYLMLQRNLIYTAVTRVKKLCMLVGTTNALSIAVESMNASRRNSNLKERLAT